VDQCTHVDDSILFSLYTFEGADCSTTRKKNWLDMSSTKMDLYEQYNPFKKQKNWLDMSIAKRILVAIPKIKKSL